MEAAILFVSSHAKNRTKDEKDQTLPGRLPPDPVFLPQGKRNREGSHPFRRGVCRGITRKVRHNGDEYSLSLSSDGLSLSNDDGHCRDSKERVYEKIDEVAVAKCGHKFKQTQIVCPY